MAGNKRRKSNCVCVENANILGYLIKPMEHLKAKKHRYGDMGTYIRGHRIQPYMDTATTGK
jgi:hypothetical protein